MNNLEPRAKIGDVVIVENTLLGHENILHCKIETANLDKDLGAGVWKYVSYEPEVRKFNYFDDFCILKNLTTNISYEAND